MAEREAPAEQRLTVSVPDEGQTSTFSLGADGKPVVTTEVDGSDIRSASGDDLKILKAGDTAGAEDPNAAAVEEALAGTDGAEGDTTDGDAKDPEAPEAADELADFTELTEEVRTQYDSKYVHEVDGKPQLNFEAFNAEFAKERKQEDGTVKRDLNAGTRKYLQEVYGISNQMIDSHLAGVVAQEKLFADTFHEQFGADAKEGKQAYDKMVSWAKESFTPEQRARYNAGMQEGGQAALDQIELLKTRYLTKNPKGLSEASTEQKKAQLGLRPAARSASPARNATAGAAGKQAPSGFANAEEHRVAQSEAMAKRGVERDAALEAVHKRLTASTFWRK